MSQLARDFWAQVWKTDKCWHWTGTTDGSGHGMFKVDLQWGQRAHRFAYEHLVGPIPEGHIVHHDCGNPACVRPEHLRPMTRGDHARLHRGGNGGATQHNETRLSRRGSDNPESGSVAGETFVTVRPV